MGLVFEWRQIARAFKRDIEVYRDVLEDPETPRQAKLLLGLAVAYLLSPIDLIPDFIPIVGQIDDLVIVPLLVSLALKSMPGGIVVRHRERAAARFR
jgi:uncharacterized membrane protein YkvA (DUF1232 family)